MTYMAVGQAMSLMNVPACEAASDDVNRLTVSPTTTIPSPTDSKPHMPRLDPARTALPPTTRPSRTRSPIGNAKFVAVAKELVPAECWMLWKAKAAHNDAAPRPATAPSNRLGPASRRSWFRRKITTDTLANG